MALTLTLPTVSALITLSGTFQPQITQKMLAFLSALEITEVTEKIIKIIEKAGGQIIG